MSDGIVHMGYRSGHPSGYTDDLGIIADRNQWVPGEMPGWYVKVPRSSKAHVVDWLRENGMEHSPWPGGIVIHGEHDKMLFDLRWM